MNFKFSVNLVATFHYDLCIHGVDKNSVDPDLTKPADLDLNCFL